MLIPRYLFHIIISFKIGANECQYFLDLGLIRKDKQIGDYNHMSVRDAFYLIAIVTCIIIAP